MSSQPLRKTLLIRQDDRVCVRAERQNQVCESHLLDKQQIRCAAMNDRRGLHICICDMSDAV